MAPPHAPSSAELHDKSFFPRKASQLFISGYQDWEDGFFNFYLMQNIVSVQKETGLDEILHVGAGSGLDVKISHPRFEILFPLGVKHVLSDINPYPSFWEKEFGHLRGMSYIKTPVDAFDLSCLDKPRIIVTKFMNHHLCRASMVKMIQSAVENDCPLVMFDLSLPGPFFAIPFMIGVLLFRLPIWFSKYLVNNMRSVSGYYEKTWILGECLFYLPFTLPAAIWDFIGFLTVYTYFDIVEIMKEQDLDPTCVEHYPYAFGMMGTTIILPHQAAKGASIQNDLL